jgi:hypothetical protein
MKNHREEKNPPSRTVTPPPAVSPEGANPGGPPLPAGWRAIATGLRGTRLYHVTLPGGGGVYWETAVILNEELVHRRFASELHALAWLTLAVEPGPSANPFDLEELNGSYRAAGVAAGQTAFIRRAG